MSQGDLATAAGLSMRTVGNYERGRVPDSTPIVPDGYYDVASVLGWTRGSIEAGLAGGQPEMATPQEVPPTESVLSDMARPVLNLADAALDMGAPSEVVDRYRMAAVGLIGWMANQSHDPVHKADLRLAASRAHAIGEGVPEDDAERMLQFLEGDK